MCNANTAIERTCFPLLTVDKLIVKLRNATQFSKLDLNQAFHQLELEPESHYITNFQTEDQIKQYKRLLLGIHSAPEELQHTLQTLLADIRNAVNIAGNIVVFGKSVDEH